MASPIEYGLIAALVAVAGVTAVQAINYPAVKIEPKLQLADCEFVAPTMAQLPDEAFRPGYVIELTEQDRFCAH